ncbi:MAG TPA: gamma-glutamylcyclotransferase family protein [Micropepsaceae bacterium]|nr:gamma-glutamylcyclotransferase family protein [Micropepsaceae bacterium]
MTTELPLFAYGTLGDSEVQQILFGEVVPCEPATLFGWQVTSGSDPYLNIARNEDAATKGKLLHLSRDQLRVADQFEEIPFYRRIKVRPEKVEEGAWLYTRPDAAGEPHLDHRLALLPHAELLDTTREYRKQLDRCDVPFGDLYIFVPCVARDPLASVTSSGDLSRTAFTEIEVASGGMDGGAWLDLGRHLTRPILTQHMKSGQAVLALPMPALSLPVLPLLGDISRDTLRVYPRPGKNEPSLLQDWMRDGGLEPSSPAKLALFFSESPEAAVLEALNDAEAFVSVSENFAELYEDRLSAQTSTLLGIELSLLAALLR